MMNHDSRLADITLTGLFVALLVLPVAAQLVLPYVGGTPPVWPANDADGFARRSVAMFWGTTVPSGASVTVDVEPVVIEHEGWFFYNAFGEMDAFRGESPLSEDNLDAWRSVIDARRTWMAEQNRVYLPLIVPDKQSIHPDKLPPRIRKARGVTWLDQWLALWEQDASLTLDLRQHMRPGGQPLYYADDTHWNHEGAYQACSAVLRHLGRTPLPRSAFDVGTVTVTGDLLRPAGKALAPAPRRILFRRGGWKARPETFQWPMAIPPKRYGARWQQPRVYTCAGQTGTLLLVGDSFTTDPQNFFALVMSEHFERTVLLNNNPGFELSFAELQAVAEAYGATVVVECRAERFLKQPFEP